MRTKKAKKKKYFIKGPVFNEVSSVGRGANEGAHVAFLKIENTEELSKTSFVEAMEQMGMSDELRAMMREHYKKSEALSRSFRSILMNPEITNKKAKLKESLQQYMGSVISEIDDAKIIKEVKNILKPKNKKKEKDMPDEKMEKMFKSMEARLAKSEKLAEMDDNQKAFYKGLPEDERDDFLTKSSDEMNEAIEFEKKSDEVITVNGEEIKKSVVGDAGFSILKAHQLIDKAKDERIDKLEKTLLEDKESRLNKEYIEKAEKEFPNLPGSPEEKGEVIKGIEALPKEAKAAAYAMLKTNNNLAEGLYKEHGHTDPVLTDIQKSGNKEMEKIAKTFQDKDPSLTKAQAITKAMKSPAGQAVYRKMQTDK